MEIVFVGNSSEKLDCKGEEGVNRKVGQRENWRKVGGLSACECRLDGEAAEWGEELPRRENR